MKWNGWLLSSLLFSCPTPWLFYMSWRNMLFDGGIDDRVYMGPAMSMITDTPSVWRWPFFRNTPLEWDFDDPFQWRVWPRDELAKNMIRYGEGPTLSAHLMGQRFLNELVKCVNLLSSTDRFRANSVVCKQKLFSTAFEKFCSCFIVFFFLNRRSQVES